MRQLVSRVVVSGMAAQRSSAGVIAFSRIIAFALRKPDGKKAEADQQVFLP
jgi:hypothetical protein